MVEGDVECSELPGPDEGSLSGEKAGGSFLIEQARLVASKVRGQVVAGSGHWLMKEAPDAVIPAIRDFVA